MVDKLKEFLGKHGLKVVVGAMVLAVVFGVCL